MTAVPHRRTGPAGLAGAVGALAVVSSAALALMLGAGSTSAVTPAPSPLPGAPHGVSQANGVIVYGRYARPAGPDGFVRGLTIVNAAGGPPRVLSTTTACCVSVGGHTIMFTRRTREGLDDLLLTTRPGRTVLRSLAIAGMTPGLGVVSPDGSRIAVWAARAVDPHRGALEVHSGGRWYQIGRISGRRVRPLAFSPDGSQVLVFRPTAGAGVGEVGVVRIATARYQRLTPPGMVSWCCYWGSPASWSPDGRVAFAAFEHPPKGDAMSDGESAVFVTEHGTDGVRRVTDWGLWTTSARWSPDSRLVAYDTANQRKGLHDLFVIDPDGGSPSLVATPHDGGSCCALWSPNGKALIYETGRGDGHLDLWTVNLDGTGTFHLTSDASSDLTYAVTPPS